MILCSYFLKYLIIVIYLLQISPVKKKKNIFVYSNIQENKYELTRQRNLILTKDRK